MHNVKTCKAEKKRDRTTEKPEQTRGQEVESQVEHNKDELDDNRDAAPQEIDREKAIKQFREQGLQPIIRDLSEGSDEQVEDKIQQYLKKLRDNARLETEQLSMMDKGVRWAVEPERKVTEQKQGKQVHFGEEEQLGKTRAESTDEWEVTGRLAEVRTGRGSAGLVCGGDERRWADEPLAEGVLEMLDSQYWRGFEAGFPDGSDALENWTFRIVLEGWTVAYVGGTPKFWLTADAGCRDAHPS